MANGYASIFGESPVLPLERHVKLAYEATRELRAFFDAVVTEDWVAAGTLRDEITRLEHEADDLKKEIRMHLPRSLFMPVPREDLLKLLLVQDRVANRARDVASLVMSRKMKIPNEISAEFIDFVERNVDAASQACKSVRELDELFTTGFRGAEAKLVESMLHQLDDIETDTDEREYALRSSLFTIEKSLDPVDAVFLYKVIDMTGDISKLAERVGRRLELLLSH